MTQGAINALRADRDALLGICQGLDAATWAAVSGCDGWSVQDVVAHMGGLFQMVVDPSQLPDTAELPTERAQALLVDSRGSWTSEQVVADYETVSAEAIERLAGLVGQDFELELGDLGTYPADLLLNAYAMDHFIHIRADLHGPRGPIRTPAPPSDDFQLVPVIDWFEAAIPQQNPTVMAGLTGGVEVQLRGPGARTFVLGHGEPTSHIACDTAAFVLVMTQRATWEAAGVEFGGAGEQIDLLRAIHVF
jgi:uncharacterized protein (TIGR03083 family)